MPFREKFTWVTLIVTVVVAGAYILLVLGGAGGVPVASIAYQAPMIVAVVVTIALTIAGTILFGIGGGIAANLGGDRGYGDLGRVDDRDREIALRGRAAGATVASIGALLALVLAMAVAEQFWIANTLYLTFAASSAVASAVRLAAYRRGF